MNWLRVKLFPEQTRVCPKCGSVRTSRAGEGSQRLCASCEAARAKESPYVWIGRALVRRGE